jgi:hypothetical protein
VNSAQAAIAKVIGVLENREERFLGKTLEALDYLDREFLRPAYKILNDYEIVGEYRPIHNELLIRVCVPLDNAKQIARTVSAQETIYASIENLAPDDLRRRMEQLTIDRPSMSDECREALERHASTITSTPQKGLQMSL